MGQNIPLAICLAVVGSFCFALAAKVQHGAVRVEVEENAARARLSLPQLWRLLHSRTWWLGIGLMTVSLGCLLLGLSMAPVSVYQPLQLLAFPWSVALGFKTLGLRPTQVLGPTAVTVVATFAFVVLVARRMPDTPAVLAPIPLVVGTGVVYAIAALFALMGSHGRRQWRSLFWASGGALFYGLEAALMRAMMQSAAHHVWWQNPIVWAIIPALILGSVLAGAMGQQGYATGPAEVVVASMTVTSPVVAVVIGIAVLGEGAHFSWPIAVCLVALGAIAIAGVAVLAHLTQSATTR